MDMRPDMGPIVASYLPLVGAIARTFSRRLPSMVELDDLVHDGVIGLISALRRYDPGRGVRFAAYAGHRIKGAMIDGLRARDPLSRQVRRAQKAGGDAPPWPGGIQILDLDHAQHVPADEDMSPEHAVLEADLRRRVREGLAALPPRDREVVILRLVQGLPLRVVADRLSLSMTRTAEIQTRGLVRLRRFLNGEPMVRRRGRASGSAHAAAACRHRETGAVTVRPVQQEGTAVIPNRSRTFDPAAPASQRRVAQPE